MILKVLFLLLASLSLSACAGSVANRIERADALMNASGYHGKVYDGKAFQIFSAFPDPAPDRESGHANGLTVVIEGDGFAFIDRHTVSQDPTPKDPVGLRIATALKPPAVYLARPCQYVSQDICSPDYWSSDRFDPRIIASYQNVLDKIKDEHGNQSFNLVGFSGGAYIAFVMAATRDDVKRVDTVGGLLDPLRWTTYHHISPLMLPYNTSALLRRSAGTAFNHWCSHTDKAVPCVLQDDLQTRARALGLDNHEVHEFTGLAHGDVWHAYIAAQGGESPTGNF